MDIKKGLQSIGNTRFLTIYHSGLSVGRCLTPIWGLITTKVIQLKPVNRIILQQSRVL